MSGGDFQGNGLAQGIAQGLQFAQQRRQSEADQAFRVGRAASEDSFRSQQLGLGKQRVDLENQRLGFQKEEAEAGRRFRANESRLNREANEAIAARQDETSKKLAELRALITARGQDMGAATAKEGHALTAKEGEADRAASLKLENMRQTGATDRTQIGIRANEKAAATAHENAKERLKMGADLDMDKVRQAAQIVDTSEVAGTVEAIAEMLLKTGQAFSKEDALRMSKGQTKALIDTARHIASADDAGDSDALEREASVLNAIGAVAAGELPAAEVEAILSGGERRIIGPVPESEPRGAFLSRLAANVPSATPEQLEGAVSRLNRTTSSLTPGAVAGKLRKQGLPVAVISGSPVELPPTHFEGRVTTKILNEFLDAQNQAEPFKYALSVHEEQSTKDLREADGLGFLVEVEMMEMANRALDRIGNRDDFIRYWDELKPKSFREFRQRLSGLRQTPINGRRRLTR